MMNSLKCCLWSIVCCSVFGCAQPLEGPYDNGPEAKSAVSDEVAQTREAAASCLGHLNGMDLAELAELSAPETLTDEYDAQRRVERGRQPGLQIIRGAYRVELRRPRGAAVTRCPRAEAVRGAV